MTNEVKIQKGNNLPQPPSRFGQELIMFLLEMHGQPATVSQLIQFAEENFHGYTNEKAIRQALKRLKSWRLVKVNRKSFYSIVPKDAAPARPIKIL